MPFKSAVPIALLAVAGTALACPDASQSADAKQPSAILNKYAAAPQMTPVPAEKAAVKKQAAAKPAAATTAQARAGKATGG